jgi:5-methylcytosine-specific restriction enzyme A
MPSRAMSICKKIGCNALVSKPGYCADHLHLVKTDSREHFKRLDDKKTPEQKSFYSRREWTEASLRHRKTEPLCRRCRAKGYIVPVELVHHNPELQYLLDHGLSPYSDQYLESLCFNCHQSELRAKRK